MLTFNLLTVHYSKGFVPARNVTVNITNDSHVQPLCNHSSSFLIIIVFAKEEINDSFIHSFIINAGLLDGIALQQGCRIIVVYVNSCTTLTISSVLPHGIFDAKFYAAKIQKLKFFCSILTNKAPWVEFPKSWAQGANHRDSSNHLHLAPTPNFCTSKKLLKSWA